MLKPYIHKVKYYETDRMQVTHHSNYVRFMEEARIDFMEQAGMGYEKMEAEGVVSPVMGITCDYKKPTTFPDEIEIEVRALELTRLKLRMTYTMRVRGDVVCTATSLHCFMRSGRPISLEEQFPDFFRLLKESME